MAEETKKDSIIDDPEKHTDDEKAGNKVIEPETKKPEEEMFTQAQVEQMVKERLAREKKQIDKRIDEAKEAERLAALSEDDRKAEELKTAIARAEEAETKLNRQGMLAEARKMFTESGLSITDDELELVVRDDADSTKANVEKVIGLASRVGETVKTDLLKGTTPNEQTGHGTMTKEEIMAIKDDIERKQAIAENMELF